MKLQSRDDLRHLRQECEMRLRGQKCKILVCGGTGCLAGGADQIYAKMLELTEHLEDAPGSVRAEIAHTSVKTSGCMASVKWAPWYALSPITTST